MIPNAEWHYVGTGRMWFHRRWNKGFHIMTAADIGVEYEDNAEDEVEDEVLEDVPEAYIPEEELQDQAIMTDFFNMRYKPTSDTSKEHSSQLDEDACRPLFDDKIRKDQRVQEKLYVGFLLSHDCFLHTDVHLWRIS
ncbi:hypothetical protein R1sor_014195 [Riccia sorocarpa]|uniref:Uncharacterized protein n=1 Tax=Riccia sorocarpa TaxID=122646 RepID=A0ABD3HAN7_9MARC